MFQFVNFCEELTFLNSFSKTLNQLSELNINSKIQMAKLFKSQKLRSK
jgi:hypothetical protein